MACNRCGKCCEEAYRFNYIALPKDDGFYYNITVDAIDGKVINHEPCTSLVYSIKTRKAICTRHYTDKPFVCKVFPVANEYTIYPFCGFWRESNVLYR